MVALEDPKNRTKPDISRGSNDCDRLETVRNRETIVGERTVRCCPPRKPGGYQTALCLTLAYIEHSGPAFLTWGQIAQRAGVDRKTVYAWRQRAEWQRAERAAWDARWQAWQEAERARLAVIDAQYRNRWKRR